MSSGAASWPDWRRGATGPSLGPLWRCPACRQAPHAGGCRLDPWRLKAGDRFELVSGLGPYLVVSLRETCERSSLRRLIVQVQDPVGHRREVHFLACDCEGLWPDLAWPVGECPRPPHRDERPSWAEWRTR